MQKKQTILVVASLLVVVLSVTLAYFTAQIIGKKKDVSVSSADLKIIFTDSDGSISGSNIEPGKWNVTKTFTIENKSNETYKYNIVIQDLVNTFVTEGYLQYRITSTNGGYNMAEFKDVPKSSTAIDKVLAYSASIDVGVTQSYTIEFIYRNDESVDQNIDQNKELSGKLFISIGTEEPTLYNKILADNPKRKTRTDFSTTYTEENTNTLFISTESIVGSTPVDVYYFAGQAKNNWVKFGGFYWRIIRTNHDKSIRMIYFGTSSDTTSGYIEQITDGNYRYMYGDNFKSSLEEFRTNKNSSNAKISNDNWYKNNLTAYTKYLSKDAVYCVDSDLYSSDTVFDTSQYGFGFIGSYRLNKQPTYNCTNMNDAFSVNNTSAKLTYPVGLITVDEANFIGLAKGKKNESVWLLTNSNNDILKNNDGFLTLTPYSYTEGEFWFYGIESTGDIFCVRSKLGTNSPVIRPVISLKSNVLWSSGDGSASNPYEIEMN